MRKLILVGLLVVIVLLAIEVIERIPAVDEEAVAAVADDENLMVLTFGEAPDSGRIAGVDYHIVQEGETLESLAQRYFGDEAFAEDLAIVNGLLQPYEIVPGQVLDLR